MAHDVQTVHETQPAPHDLVPATRDGIPTDVVEAGVTRALAVRTERHRPAPDGVTIGHHAITAGALGCLVQRNGRVVILANNHVLTHSNDAAAAMNVFA